MRYLFPLLGLAAVLCLASAFPASATDIPLGDGERVDRLTDLDVLTAPILEPAVLIRELPMTGEQRAPAGWLDASTLLEPIFNTEHGGAVGEYDAATIAA